MNGITQADIFKGLTRQQCERVLEHGRRKRLRPQEVLFRQGDPATHCYRLQKGRIKLSMVNEQGREATIRYVGGGEMAAAVAVMKDGIYLVTAEAIEETEVTGWDKPTMIAQMHRCPDIAINLLHIILSRIDDVQQRYLEVCTEQVARRIARTLLRLMRSAGSRQAAGISIDIPLSRQDIADYAGTTLFTVSRTLSGWEKAGWIKSGREKIVVTDPHALVSFSEGA